MKTTRTQILNDPDLQIDKLNDGQLEVREVVTDESGDTVYHRYVIYPGIYIRDKDPRVTSIVDRIHTPKVVRDWQTADRARRQQLSV